MLRIGSALSLDPDPARAARQAAAGALAEAGLDRADAALVFANGHPRFEGLCGAVVDRLGTASVAGATAHGVIAGALEEEERPAVAVFALGGLETVAFGLGDLAGAEDAAGPEIESALGRSATERDLVVLLADPLALDMARLLGTLGETLGPAVLVGAGAAPMASGAALSYGGRDLTSPGACGLVLRLERPARTVLSHGCRPISDPLRVTRTEGHWIIELDGRPALDVYREVARGPLAADLRRASEHLLVALPRPRRTAGDEDYVARSLAGFAEERRAFALVEELRPGSRIRLALRDADFAREDLKRALESMRGGPPAGGLYLSCSGRGRALFGHAGLETAYVAGALAPAPLGGMFGAFQFGPVAGSTERLTYAGVLALIG